MRIGSDGLSTNQVSISEYGYGPTIHKHRNILKEEYNNLNTLYSSKNTTSIKTKKFKIIFVWGL